MPVQPGLDQPNTAAAIRYVKAAFGLDSFGWRPKGSVPGSDHPKGLALDIPIAPGKRELGDRIAEWFIEHAEAFGTTYVIWRGRIRNPGGPWRPYSGPNPHDDHVHVSLRAGWHAKPPGGGGGLSGLAGDLAGDVVGAVVTPALAGARKTALLVAFTGLGLGLVALGAWRGARTLKTAS